MTSTVFIIKNMNRILQLEAVLVKSNPQINDFQDLLRQGKVDREDLLLTVYGPNHAFREFALQVVRKNKELFKQFNITEASRQQQRRQSFKMVKALVMDNLEKVEQFEADPNKLSLYGCGGVSYDLGVATKQGIHLYLYSQTIIKLGTEKHLPFFNRFKFLEDIGCFALTQFAHGSDAKGIQTEAHYVHSTREYILRTPNKDSMKFWIGGAAQVANMSIVMAQLYIGDKCYGVHAFLVPLRDRSTHRLLPGVIIGDCGPKLGLHMIDNGYIMFDNFRIPADNQLNKISGVDNEGNFVSSIKREDKRFGMHLLALSSGRFHIWTNTSNLSIVGLTIAIRYACVRRQFSKKAGERESLLIEYPLTKRRMMPIFSQALVYITTGYEALLEWDSHYFEDLLQTDTSKLEELHAISSVMKAKASWSALECIRECRQMMGGNGYSLYSKMASLYNDIDVNVTWEGDNNVIIQQTTKYVLDKFKLSQQGKSFKSQLLMFLADPPAEIIQFTQESFLSIPNGLKFFQFKLVSKINEMVLRMITMNSEKVPLMDIWNANQVYLGKAIAMAFGDLHLVTKMLKKIQESKSDKNRIILRNVTNLWLLKVYREDEFIDESNHSLLETLIMEYSELLCVDSLAILEVISAGDEILGSPFADPQGKGMDKYLELIFSRPNNIVPECWSDLASR